jgi:hypothetical protein
MQRHFPCRRESLESDFFSQAYVSALHSQARSTPKVHNLAGVPRATIPVRITIVLFRGRYLFPISFVIRRQSGCFR